MKIKIKFPSSRYVKLTHSFKDSFWALLFSFMFNLIFAIGFYLDREIIGSPDHVGIGHLIYTILLIVLFSLIGAELYLRFYDFLGNRISSRNPEITNHDTGYYFICFAITILLWLPVLLAYYPGLFAYDVEAQIPQTAGTYTTHHPLIHTLILQFFYYIMGDQFLGSYNKGMLCYTLLQMIILAAAVAYMHLFLYRMKVGKKSRIVILIFTSIFPVYSVLSISITKDILFSAFYLVAFICLCYREILPDFFKKKHLGILYVFSVVSATLFRNNGIYAVIMMLVFGLFFLRKEKKDILFLTIIGIILSILLSGILKYSVDAAHGPRNEMLSVPYQQLCYIYNTNKEELSFEDMQRIERFIPNVESYRLHCADPVKISGQAGKDIKGFLSLYFEMLVKYPVSYVKAFLYNSMGYWYLLDTSNAEIYGFGLETRQGYLLTDTKQGFGVVHVSYFPALENLYENLFSLNEYQRNPLLFILCSMALYIWAIVLCAFFTINLKQKQAALPVILLLGYIITMLAGPCALIRYVFPIISCIPPLYVTTFQSRNNFIEQKK